VVTRLSSKIEGNYGLQQQQGVTRTMNKRKAHLLSFPSPLQSERLKFKPVLPSALLNEEVELGATTGAAGDVDKISKIFPNLFGKRIVHLKKSSKINSPPKSMRIGVVLSGGQASGGHNCITSMFDCIERAKSKAKSKHKYSDDDDFQLIGFKNGPKGIFTGDYIVLTSETVNRYRNTGGFDIIGSGRDKIHSPEQFENSLKHCENLRLDGLVVIGGDDSNTNACLLAEYFLSKKSRVCVCGIPKTIDGDLKHELIPISFGFDTATKVYSELIGNVATDALSSRKKFHFVRLMGRSASHVTLECALRCRPNLTFVGEEIREKKWTIQDVTNQLVDMIEARIKQGTPFGVILLPEGMIEFIDEIGVLISEINEIVVLLKKGHKQDPQDQDELKIVLSNHLTSASKKTFEYLPSEIQNQLLLDRDSHGNVAVSQIETERLLVTCALSEMQRRGNVAVSAFKFQNHFFGYEGRSAIPSNFDSTYCYALGYTAATLIKHKKTGLIAAVSNLSAASPTEWTTAGVPLTHLMNVERRAGKEKPVIAKALTRLFGFPFREFAEHREKWILHSDYISPGPIQFGGSTANDLPITLRLEIHERNVSGTPSKSKKRRRGSVGTKHVELVYGNHVVEKVRDPTNEFKLSLFSEVLVPNLARERTLDQRSDLVLSEHEESDSKKKANVVRLKDSHFKILSQIFPKTCTSQDHKLIDLSKSSNSPTTSKKTVGVVFCGRQCAAHSAVYGLIKESSDQIEVLGFLGGMLERENVIVSLSLSILAHTYIHTCTIT